MQVAVAAFVVGTVLGWNSEPRFASQAFLGGLTVVTAVVLVLGTAIIASSWLGGTFNQDIYKNLRLFSYPIIAVIAGVAGIFIGGTLGSQ